MKDLSLNEKIKILAEAKKSFYFFTTEIFSKGFSNFIGGSYIEKSCNYLSKYNRTMRVAARSHFKSTSIYAKVQRDIMFEGMQKDLDIRYFSYSHDLAGWHIQQIKSLIAKNPYFRELVNLKSSAENVAQYTWDRKHIINLRPAGIVSFTRGLKADKIYADDILSDPANPIHPTIILKINDLFKSVILESIKRDGEIHVVGSPLSLADLYFDPGIQKEFHTIINPGIIEDEQGKEVPQWPEYYTLEQLKAKIPVMGERIFAAEIMCTPFYATDSFFKKEQLRKDVINPQLKNLRLIEGLDTKNLVIAGLDIGKKIHPSVLNVFEVVNGRAIHVHRKKMIKWPYYTGNAYDPLKPSQIEYCKEAIKNFSIDLIYYDNTRGEFEGANDSGLLTDHFVPTVMNAKLKIQIATEFEKIVLNKQLELLDDEDMLSSICSVTNDLQKIQSATGDHGDDFDSIALALIGFSKFGIAGDDRVTTGAKSIFGSESPPTGW